VDKKQRLLDRLDAIGQSLKATGNALALLGLGSVGQELDRLDDYSDLDFFAIVKPGYKAHFIKNLDWLSSICPIAYQFQNTVDGYKVLYEDDIFCEFAVFEPDELLKIPFVNGRIIWKAEEFDEMQATPPKINSSHKKPVEFLLGEALTNLYVGLGRLQRGEKLSAARFIQGYAVDRILELAEYIAVEQPAHKDIFVLERRFEQRFPDIAHLLPDFVQGYNRSKESARAILDFLDHHFEVNLALKQAIITLIES
jgi:hypothetical protein